MECGETDIIDDRQTGDSICASCGLVIDDRAWDTSCQSKAEPLGRKTLSSQTITKCPRRLLYASGDASKLRSLVATCCELRIAAANIGLTDSISDTAKQMWEEISDQHVCRGELKLGLMAACIYFSCKLARFPRTKEVVSGACNILPETLGKACKLYNKIRKPARRDSILMCSPTESRDVLSTCISMVGVDLIPQEAVRAVTAKARLADEQITKCGVLEGKTPRVRAAAAISIGMEWSGLSGRERLYAAVHVSQYTLSRTLSVIKAHTTLQQPQHHMT